MADSVTEAAVERSLNDHVGEGREVAQSTQVVIAHHAPGMPLELAEDAESSRAYEAMLEATRVDTHVNEHVREYDGIDTRTPEANLATRSNIVSDGPGTAGAVGSRAKTGR